MVLKMPVGTPELERGGEGGWWAWRGRAGGRDEVAGISRIGSGPHVALILCLFFLLQHEHAGDRVAPLWQRRRAV